MDTRLVAWLNVLRGIRIAGFFLIPMSLYGQSLPLNTTEGLQSMNVDMKAVEYQGKKAVRIVGGPGYPQIALVKGSQFFNGVIEAEIAGNPHADADSTARGFVGIAFRVRTSDTLRYECVYIRPTNGRAEDQIRRNHSTQYISEPGYPWYVLRRESPGRYESYVDLIPGAWTKIKIVVKGSETRLYVHGADQPCLIVHDLKQKAESGMIGLWIGLGTEAYFTDLKLTPTE